MKTLLISLLIVASSSVFADGIIMDLNTGNVATYNTQGNTTTVMDLQNGNTTMIIDNNYYGR